MKPIPSLISKEAYDLMNKAQDMISRIDSLNKAGDTFTIGDAAAGNPKSKGIMGNLEEEMDERNRDLSWEEYSRLRELEGRVGEEEGMATREESAPLPHSEEKIRDQKRGEEGRGRNVFKRPDDENAKKLTPEQRGIKPVAVSKSGDSGSQPTFATTFNTNPQDMAFVSESGGQTRNAYYSTNQHLLDSESVTNKGSTSVSISLEKLASMLNPHEGGGVSRLDDGGVLKSKCENCGGNQYSGCRGNCPNKRLN